MSKRAGSTGGAGEEQEEPSVGVASVNPVRGAEDEEVDNLAEQSRTAGTQDKKDEMDAAASADLEPASPGGHATGTAAGAGRSGTARDSGSEGSQDDDAHESTALRADALDNTMIHGSADNDVEEDVNRNGSACFRVLKFLRLDRFLEKPVQVPKKGQPVESIHLDVPLTRAFLKEQASSGAQPRRTNAVRTSKYSPWSFIPLAAGYQFRRFVNFFFLCIVILLVVGNWNEELFLTPWQATGTAAYLAILVISGMLVEGLDDLAKHRGDKEENSRLVKRVRFKDGALVDSTWGELLPGDLVVVNNRNSFPADLVLLYGTATDKKNSCYIETSGIDGETNLKIKEVPAPINRFVLGHLDETCLSSRDTEIEAVAKVLARAARGRYEYEQPNAFLQFDGSFTPSRAKMSLDKIPLEFKHLILRGSELRNTKWIIGMVAYAGHETKLALSRKPSPVKFSRIDVLVNRLMFTLLGVYFAIVILADILLFQQTDTSEWWYFQFSSSTQNYKVWGGLAFFITFCIMFSNLIPISMVLLIEIINKYSQKMIDLDREMYHEATDTPAKCRTASLTAEVGQITHFFSDKTGTLTRNEMKLVGTFIAGKAYGFQPPAVTQSGQAVQTSETNGGHAGEDVKGSLSIAPSAADGTVATSSAGVSPESDESSPAAATIGDATTEEVFADIVALLQEPAGSAGRQEVLDMLVFLSVCHTVILDQDPVTKVTSLNAESPDEEAFVRGAEALGIKLLQSSDGSVRLQLPNGEIEEYLIVALNPFNSTRKRMSLVVERSDGSLSLLMKGADNVMLERLAPGQDEYVAILSDQLLRYAWGGLRTLVMGRRDLTEDEFVTWQQRHREAMVAPSSERKEALAHVAEQIERDVTIVGATAIEDQLQLGVPEAIQTLRDAGVQVWVLTGDKVETAINIGLSSRLLDNSMDQLKLISRDEQVVHAQVEAVYEAMREATSISAALSQGANAAAPSSTSSNHASSNGGDQQQQGQQQDIEMGPASGPSSDDRDAADSLALVVSGDALELLLTEQKGSPELEAKFLHVARNCKVVLACRVSPKQKSLIVEMVRHAPDNKKLKREPITLAIGDGANDVPMIQTAHVGIGISGHEGRQAVNSSDFSIAQFRFVVRLMLVHGRWNYRRQAAVIVFLIYCWLIYICTLYIFQIYCHWSGQQVYYEYLYTFFAPGLFNFAVIAHGWFNQDLAPETVLSNPWVYEVGAKNMDLNLAVFRNIIIRVIVHLVIIWCFIFLAMPEGTPQAVFGSTAFTTIFLVEYFEQLIIGDYITNGTVAAFTFIIVAFLIGMSLVTTPAFLFYPGANPAMAWSQIFLVVVTILAVDMGYAAIRRWYFPRPLDILVEQDRGYMNGVKSKPRAVRDGMKVLRETGRLIVSPVPLSIGALRRATNKRMRTSAEPAPQAGVDADDGGIGPVQPAFVYDGPQGMSQGPEVGGDDDAGNGGKTGASGEMPRRLSEISMGGSRVKLTKHDSHMANP
ncbi:Phospholipid-transporting ATPase [Hondaea fermentalgiana]|uniref:Phospholipid-transporting ATPase n=1 Tax=Hondaea fermentalgiana TaxID=2315210 RepID=A0A2R5GZB1_9STRA|nr:Phospholipid-transporting ATPase [Hondaea fermentalgiana]|eukprot:GBG34093.1 Phospholipid-transporting ATPase [Hondaea fermentalgiana]